MEVDTPPEDIPRDMPWYSRGTYSFNGVAWQKLSDAARQRRVAPIGYNKIEIEQPASTAELPQATDGHALAFVTVTPSNKKATFSGHGTLWVDITKSGNVWISVFRGTTLVGLVAEWFDAGKPRTMSFSFVDIPATHLPITYTAKIHTDIVGFLYMNGSSKFNFDGGSQTAFIVAENN
jgi:hypothetical protein